MSEPVGSDQQSSPPMPLSAMSTIKHLLRLRPRRASSSSTQWPWAKLYCRSHTQPSLPPPIASMPLASAHSEPQPWCGIAQRASPWGQRLAGKTCAPSSTASWPKPIMALRSPRISRPPSWLGCSTPTTPIAHATCCSAPSIAGLLGWSRAARCTSPTTPTLQSPACTTQRCGTGQREHARRSTFRCECCPPLSIPAANSAQQPHCQAHP